MRYEIIDPVYLERIWLCVAEPEKFTAWSRKRYGCELVPDGAANVWTLNNADGRLERVVWLKDMQWCSHEYGMIAHEAFHVAAAVMRLSGVTLCKESEEAFAYYVGFLTTAFIRAMMKDFGPKSRKRK